MPKRMTWFVVGAVAGAGGSLYAKAKAKRTIERLQPTNVVRLAATKARDTSRGVVDAVRECRAAMQDKEVELRQVRDGGGKVVRASDANQPTIVVIDAAGVLDADEFRTSRSGPRRRSRR